MEDDPPLCVAALLNKRLSTVLPLVFLSSSSFGGFFLSCTCRKARVADLEDDSRAARCDKAARYFIRYFVVTVFPASKERVRGQISGCDSGRITLFICNIPEPDSPETKMLWSNLTFAIFLPNAISMPRIMLLNELSAMA